MKTYIALIRGINVGGHGRLPMAELKLLCENLGFKNVRTYIQSGNVIFESNLSEEKLIENLEKALLKKMQKPIPVIIRSVEELESVIGSNPFPEAVPSQVGVMFFVNSVRGNMLDNLVLPGREEIKISGREIYIHYPDGMGCSRLKLPIKSLGTVRNINTVTKIAENSR